MSDAAPDPTDGPDGPAEPSRGARLLRIGRELLIFVALGLVAIGVAGQLRGPDLPDTAPDFALPDLAGRTVRLADYAGRPLVLNFWATWCTPCRVEAPGFVAFARANPDIPVLGVAVDGTVEGLAKTAAEWGIDYPIVRADQATLAAYGVDVYPTTVVLDGRGRVVDTHAGLMLRPHLWWSTRGLGD